RRSDPLRQQSEVALRAALKIVDAQQVRVLAKALFVRQFGEPIAAEPLDQPGLDPGRGRCGRPCRAPQPGAPAWVALHERIEQQVADDGELMDVLVPVDM